MSDEARTSDDLREEAKQLLSSLLRIPEGTSSVAAERLVDCIIGAAVMETANLVRKAMREWATKTTQ